MTWYQFIAVVVAFGTAGGLLCGLVTLGERPLTGMSVPGHLAAFTFGWAGIWGVIGAAAVFLTL